MYENLENNQGQEEEQERMWKVRTKVALVMVGALGAGKVTPTDSRKNIRALCPRVQC